MRVCQAVMVACGEAMLRSMRTSVMRWHVQGVMTLPHAGRLLVEVQQITSHCIDRGLGCLVALTITLVFSMLTVTLCTNKNRHRP